MIARANIVPVCHKKKWWTTKSSGKISIRCCLRKWNCTLFDCTLAKLLWFFQNMVVLMVYSQILLLLLLFIHMLCDQNWWNSHAHTQRERERDQPLELRVENKAIFCTQHHTYIYEYIFKIAWLVDGVRICLQICIIASVCHAIYNNIAMYFSPFILSTLPECDAFI